MTDDCTDLSGEKARPNTRKRQIYAPRYATLWALFQEQLRGYAIREGYWRAKGHARRLAAKQGDTEFPSEPSPELIDWWQRKRIREDKADIRRNTDREMGWDANGRRRAQWRNSKLKHAALRHQAGEGRSTLYNTDRKLMTLEERAAHDKRKRNERQRLRRAAGRSTAKTPPVRTVDHPNFGRF